MACVAETPRLSVGPKFERGRWSFSPVAFSFGAVDSIYIIKQGSKWRILIPLGVKVFFRPNVTLRQLLVRPKVRIRESEATGVVYQVPCASCPTTYVGQTGRRLDQRLREHRRAVESADFTSSALAEHAWSCHHPVDLDNTRILDHHHHLHQRLILRVSSH